MFRFPNPDNDKWLNKYNELVAEVEKQFEENLARKQSQPKRNDHVQIWSGDAIGIHHIIPKKVLPDLVNSKDNLLLVSLKDHCQLHYYLWKYNWQYATHFWFLLQAARKFNWWQMPGGEQEYMQIRADVAKCRQLRKQGIEWCEELTYAQIMSDVKAMPANEEALNFERDDSKYYFTKSAAYAANSTNLPIDKEPWLHVKLISVTKKSTTTEVHWYAVVYVWDTRQVVQWVELPAGTAMNVKTYKKVFDNGNTLKDSADKVPGWAKRFVLGRSWPSEP